MNGMSETEYRKYVNRPLLFFYDNFGKRAFSLLNSARICRRSWN